MSTIIDSGRVAGRNAQLRAGLNADYGALGGILARRGVDIEKLTTAAQSFRLPCPAGASAPAARALRAFPAVASRATCLKSWTTAP
jgi:L-rhamnose isomerase/sugar isomerase